MQKRKQELLLSFYVNSSLVIFTLVNISVSFLTIQIVFLTWTMSWSRHAYAQPNGGALEIGVGCFSGSAIFLFRQPTSLQFYSWFRNVLQAVAIIS